MYAFGLLGAFSLTCLGMDIVRYRQRRYRRLQAQKSAANVNSYAHRQLSSTAGNAQNSVQETELEHQIEEAGAKEAREEEQANPAERPEAEGRWTRSTLNFWLGILTTLLVLIAWSTNLIAKPLATAFGGSVALIGMAIAFTSYRLHRRKGRIPVVATGIERDFPGAVLAVLADGNQANEAVIHSALHNLEQQSVIFLYLGERTSKRKPELFRLVEPHLHDEQARKDLGRANYLAQEAKIECRFLYRHREPDAIYRVWQELHPRDTIVAEEQMPEVQRIHPMRMYEEATPGAHITHLLN
jgi:hypothetical protein